MANSTPPRFTQACFDWMADMTFHNTREQFLASKPIYEVEVRGKFIALLQDLKADFPGEMKVFRPNRDVRFSNDKRPYKTNVSGYLESDGVVYYTDLSLDGLMIATGYYQMAKDQLERYRQALIGDDGPSIAAELRSILANIPASTEGLKTVPRGFAKDHPEADLLRLTSVVLSITVPIEDILATDVLPLIRDGWNSARPLNTWLTKHVGPSTLPRPF